MNAEKPVLIPLNKRVEKMDMELKEHFVEFRSFVSDSLAGLEARLTERFDDRLDGFEKRFGARLDGILQPVRRPRCPD